MGHVRRVRYRSPRPVALSAVLQGRPLLRLGCLGACRNRLRSAVVFFIAAFRANPLCGASLATLVSSVRVGLNVLPNSYEAPARQGVKGSPARAKLALRFL